jgi:hypothetical protein
MKKTLSPRFLFSLGFMVIIAANIMVIYHVSTNRTGPYETMIELTERELALPYRMHEENSGISLRLRWGILGQLEEDDYRYESRYQSPAWMDQEKLASLGFDTRKASSEINFEKEIVPRRAFIVLEYDGAAYQEALRRSEKQFESAQKACQSNPGNEKLSQDLKNAETRLQQDRTHTSRLFAVDAGPSAEMLRKKYPDQSRFIIAPGIVKVDWNYENKKPVLNGHVSNLLVENIHVPLEFRRPMDDILLNKHPDREADSPRYKVQLAYGARFEPWIRSVTRTPSGPEK